MLYTFTLPRLGDTVEEVVVLEWLVAIGGRATEGQPLLRVETAKVEVEVDAPVSGVLMETLVEVDAEVVTGAPVAVIDADQS